MTTAVALYSDVTPPCHGETTDTSAYFDGSDAGEESENCCQEKLEIWRVLTNVSPDLESLNDQVCPPQFTQTIQLPTQTWGAPITRPPPQQATLPSFISHWQSVLLRI